MGNKEPRVHPATEHLTWDGEVCDRCHRRNVVGFNVPDDVWAEITSSTEEYQVLCVTCFDEVAEYLGVPYNLTAIWPVSWSDWRD